MEPGTCESGRWLRRWLRLRAGLCLCLLAGCAGERPHLDQALMAVKGIAEGAANPAAFYTVGCPDVLAVTVPGRPDLSGRYSIGPDGRIDLGDCGQPRLEGHTASECTRLLAGSTGDPHVQVAVAAYNSRQVYLFGQVKGLQRAVPYEGPETVLGLLQRTGGITAGAAANDIYVVRSRIADGKPPEVFHVDLQSIVLKQDEKTNLHLQPFDQVYIGETRQSSVEKCVPPCLRPVYEAAWGLRRHGRDSDGERSDRVKTDRVKE
jgi:polysaccharide export outer membrane protein